MTLREHYLTTLRADLGKNLGITNVMAVPRFTSVTIAVGLSANQKDQKYAEVAESVLTRISGQRPVKTKAKKSISNFKIRKGMVVGLRVTLRGKRMWDFVEKLIRVTLPRIRDFRGISSKNIDAQGNMTLGFREFLSFPEIRPDEVERVHGLQVTLSTTAGTAKNGLALFRSLGFPFKD